MKSIKLALGRLVRSALTTARKAAVAGATAFAATWIATATADGTVSFELDHVVQAFGAAVAVATATFRVGNTGNTKE